jgi:aminopeptidase N
MSGLLAIFPLPLFGGTLSHLRYSTASAVACAALLLSHPASADPPDLAAEAAGKDAPDRTIDIQHLALDLAVDVEAGRLEGTATLTARPLREGLREIVLNQVGLDIRAVEVDGASAGFELGPTTLGIAVDGARPVGTDLSITIRYAAEPSNGMHFRRPGKTSPDTYVEAWTQGENIDNRHWIPTWDFPNDRFTYEGRFTVPDRFTVLSNGALESKAPSSESGQTTWHFALRDQDLVSYLVMFAAAEYRFWKDEWRGRQVGYYVPPDSNEAEARLLLGKTPRMLDWMSEFLGVDYPYPVYNQVLVQRFIYTGMENTTATVLDRSLLYPPAPHRPGRRPESVIAHELAHQWFGDQLTCRTWAHMWLNEGITSWVTDEWLRAEYGEDEWADGVHRRYAGLVRSDDQTAYPMVGTFYNRTGGRTSAHVYTRGATVTHMLRVLLGDEAFFRGVNLYITRHQHGLVETEDLRRAMEDASGLHLRWFFDQWVYLAGHPKLKVSHAVDAESGRLRLSIKQTQPTDGIISRFHLPLDVEIGTSEGSRVERLVLDGEETALSLDLGGADLAYVAVDPLAGILMELEQKQTPQEWLAQLASPHAFARRRAIEGLKGIKGTIPDPVREHVASLATDREADGTTRRLAVTVLGEWRDDASARTLLDVLAGEPSDAPYARLRSEVVQELAKFEATPEVLAALSRYIARDADDWGRSQALRTLSTLQERRVRSRAIAVLRGPKTDGWSLQSAAVDALGKWGEVKDIQVLKTYFQPGSPGTRLRHRALRAAARVAGRQPVGPERDRARQPVRDAAEAWLESLHLRDRQAALGVLGRVGDSGSIQRIEAMLRWDDTPSMPERAEAIAEKIRSRKEVDAEETSGELKAKLKKLEEKLEAMDKELQGLLERP